MLRCLYFRMSRLLIFAVLSLLSLFAWSSANSTMNKNGLSEKKPDLQNQSSVSRDPCWFMKLNNKSFSYDELKIRDDREMYGYPRDVPLSEAIKIFNEEKQCQPLIADYPILTEEELIASIVAGPGYGGYGMWGEVWKIQKDTLWEIATKKVMPKGSLLVCTTGSDVQESPLRPHGTIKSRGIAIAIFLSLENHKHGERLKPEQIFQIRRTYFKVDTIK